MTGAPSPRSWRATPTALVTPAYTLLALVALLASAEIGARRPALRDVLLVPSVSSSSRRFELQLDGLQRYAESNGHVDCLILGNSIALTGVDPDALDHASRARTGNPLHCYNFGVAGMTASAAGAVATILVQQYRPALLVYVLSARDVGSSVDGPLLAAIPWVRYRLGEPSLDGWLTDHSAAYRYYLLYRQWLDPQRWPAATSPSGATSAGFFALRVTLPLSPTQWDHTQRVYRDILAQPLSEPELAGFRRVLQLSTDTRVVLVEAPAHSRLREWTHASRFYRDATGSMREEARHFGVPFWRVGPRVVDAAGWADFVHVNAGGAAQLSEWLGARLAALLQGNSGDGDAMGSQ